MKIMAKFTEWLCARVTLTGWRKTIVAEIDALTEEKDEYRMTVLALEHRIADALVMVADIETRAAISDLSHKDWADTVRAVRLALRGPLDPSAEYREAFRTWLRNRGTAPARDRPWSDDMETHSPAELTVRARKKAGTRRGRP